jgi:lysine 2,3-aminomutase
MTLTPHRHAALDSRFRGNDVGVGVEEIAPHFGLQITPAMKKLIDPNDPNDPIAAQFIPSDAENIVVEQELADPIGDENFSPLPGIVHRYPDRVLLKLLHICAVHCRFCFRREQIGKPDNALDGAALDKAFGYIAEHPEIWEVILTGGDPLLLSRRRLAEVVERLNAIPHVKIIRIHTRIPVIDPARITPELVAVLRSEKPVYILLHCNHARELTPEARAACARLIDAGLPMLSQSVLLRGVNDDAETLADLMRAFVETRVSPHYMHHGDMVRGTSHFRVSLAHGQALMRGLRGHLSGLCQPHYMLDIPGGHGKSPVGPVYARPIDDMWIVEDYRGKKHLYRDTDAASEDKTS